MTHNVILPRRSIDPDATLEERMTENAYNRILPARYLIKDEDGNTVEEPEELFERVAQNIAEAELEYGNTQDHVDHWENQFETAMTELRFMPNSPTLMNAGVPEMQQLSACFVDSPTEDDMYDINETQTEAAAIFKSGGGVGYDFSQLRPKGARVESTGGVSSGPLSFMDLFDTTCNTVKQGGKRRGAQMAQMSVHHPDIGRFCTAKRVEGASKPFSNFNISASITHEFLEAVKNDEEYTFRRLWSEEGHQTDEPAIVTEATKKFYSTEYEDASPKAVDTNIWRDYAHEIDGIEEFRGETNLTVGEPMRLPARFIWTLISDGAHKNGEPGVFYIDEANDEHSFDVEEHPDYFMNATNPCAEQMLMEYEACNLGHINLSLMVRDDAPKWDEYEANVDYDEDELDFVIEHYLDVAVDWEELTDTIHVGTRFLDNVVTQSEFPLDEITERVKDFRKIGLGLMGYHHMLLQMGIEYGSEESYEVARKIMHFIDKEATDYSHLLASQRGPFKAWEDSKYANPTEYPDWFEKHTGKDPAEYEDGFLVRNHNLTTIAPTGTTSMISNTSGGCEPIYQVAFYKNVGEDIQAEGLDDDKVEMLVEFDDYFLRVLEANNIDVTEVKRDALEQMEDEEQTFEGVESLDLPKQIKDLFVVSDDLSAEDHIRMQAAFQEECDSGISKTINAAPDTSRSDVADALMLALDLGIKGTTVYRKGSREKEVKKENKDSRIFSEEDKEMMLKNIEKIAQDDEQFAEAVSEAVTTGSERNGEPGGDD